MTDMIVDVNTQFGPLPLAAADLSVDELGALMDKHSVRACCTLSTIGVYLDAAIGNAATRAACAENRSLVAAATVNPQNYFGGDGAAVRFVADGFRLLRVFPATQGWAVDYAPFAALLRHLDSEKLPLMVEIAGSGAATRLMRAVGEHEMPIVLAGIDDRGLAEAVALMQAHPRLYIETSEVLAMGALKQLVDSVGADRVLFGSGAPSRPISSGLAVVAQSGLSDAERAQVLGGNARTLLGL
jgi:predicted TIM-barrel fold metal-dependent hydrolase